MPATTDKIPVKRKPKVGQSNTIDRMTELYRLVYEPRYRQLHLPLFTITDKYTAIEQARREAVRKNRDENWHCYGGALHHWIASQAVCSVADVKAYLGENGMKTQTN